MGISPSRIGGMVEEFKKVAQVLETCKPVNPAKQVPTDEFLRRQTAVADAVAKAGVDVGIVFSDEHYRGDVPYLGGNINVSIEQVAGVIGKTGFHIVAGLEGGYVAEQLAGRADATVHKVELLQLADEKYPIDAERLEDVLEAANDGPVARVGLLTPRQVIPAALVEYLEDWLGKENVVDVQESYYEIKYEKSEAEMELIHDACQIADAMMKAMLVTLQPGMLETQVAGWAEFVAKELGAESLGFKTMVGANTANRTLIGPALNREIREGDFVHLGVAPQRDGLTACVRRSVVAGTPTEDQQYWLDFIESAYREGYRAYREVAEKNFPAKYQEKALMDYFSAKSDEVSERIGRKVQLERQKPYTGTHNSGYTECQEFYGAITLESDNPLGNQIVTMLDVAIRGIGNKWDDVVIPGLDFVVIENTLGKFGPKVQQLNQLPNNVQHFVIGEG